MSVATKADQIAPTETITVTIDGIEVTALLALSLLGSGC